MIAAALPWYIVAGMAIWLLYDLASGGSAHSVRVLVAKGYSARVAALGVCATVLLMIAVWPIFFGSAFVSATRQTRGRP